MDLDLSEDQLAFRQAARTFAERAMAPHAARWDAEHCFPLEVLREAAHLGFLGLYVPEQHGGMGLSRVDTTIILEELAQACPSTTAYLTVHNMVAWMIAEYGSDELASAFVPRLCSGDWLGSYCLTEPGAGSDAASLRTRATRYEDEYVLDGEKMFISGGGQTQVLLVMARTGTEDSGAKGITAFVVPAETPGITYGEPEDKMGWHSQPTCSVFMEDVHVPVRNRLGDEGDGFRLAMRALDGGRLNIATCSLGGAQASLLRARDHLHHRKQFGQTLASFQALQFKLADMATALTAARQMVRLGAFKLDQNDPQASVYCAMAKRYATDACFDVCNEALQLHGGYGYIRDYPFERFVRDLRVHQILEGTNEIMRHVIARRILEPGVLEDMQ